MSFPRYPKYKDSGVEWLGKVPESWEVDRIKWSTTCCRNGIWGGEAQQDDGDIPCVRVADFDRERLRVVLNEPTIRNVPEKDRGGRLLRQGDLLLEKSGGGESQPVGCVVLYDDPTPAVCSNFVARVAVAEEMHSSFWRYVHAAAYAIRLNTRSIKQTSGIQNLDSSQYFDERSAFPPPVEQTAIAAFLDRETAKIDALVAEQRRLMELLKEKRQAVISHAVTKGLNPDAPMKDSGIEWLGEVPTHWELTRLKHLVIPDRGIQMGPFGGMLKDLETEPAAHKLYGQENTINDNFDAGSRWLSVAHFERLREYELKPGDVVLTRKGASIGNCRVVPTGIQRGVIDSDTIRVRLDDRFISVGFAVLLMHEGYMEVAILQQQKGAVLPGLNTGTIANLLIALPPMTEQFTIMEFLTNELHKFDTLTAEAQRAIDLLQERRAALISAAVTGQIDVRTF